MTQPASPPQQSPASRRLSLLLRAPLPAALTGRLGPRGQRPREEQRQRAWDLVAQMRVTVAKEGQRRRQRERLYALLLVATIAVDAALLYLVLHGFTL